jgi:hypothetical protein
MSGRYVLAIAAVGCFAASARAASLDPIYTATDLRMVFGAVPPKAYYYEPGFAFGGQPGHILLDDVTVHAPGTPVLPQTLFNVKKITFGITRKAAAPAVAITPYYATLQQDAFAFGGTGDGPNYDPLSPTPIAAPVNLPANPGGLVQDLEISFGFDNGYQTLFNVTGATASPDTNYRSFAAGLNFSVNDGNNGWTVAKNLDNLDLLWDYISNADFDEFTFETDGEGPIIGTQYVKVYGLVLSGVAADADVDGDVDVNDLGILASNWQTTNDFVNGDFDFSGFVDVNDLGILASNWQVGVGGGPSLQEAMAQVGLGNVAIPEPAALALLPLGLALARRRRA